VLRWEAAEREAWLEEVTNNPLLPGRILLSDYLAQQACGRLLRPAAGGSAPGRQPATAHVQTRMAMGNTLLHMQQ
jgi:hypothetical protein